MAARIPKRPLDMDVYTKGIDRLAVAVESLAATYARANRTTAAYGEPFNRFTTCPECKSQWSPAELQAFRKRYRARVGDKSYMRTDCKSWAACPFCNATWGW